MQQIAKRQISFKLDPETAARLDELARNHGVSCHELARSLMLLGLGNPPPTDQALAPPQTLDPATLASKLDELLSAVSATRTDSDAATESLGDNLVSVLKNQETIFRATRLLAAEIAHLRTRHLPTLRADMLTAVTALLCKNHAANVPAAEASEWVHKMLGAPIPPFTPPDA